MAELSSMEKLQLSLDAAKKKDIESFKKYVDYDNMNDFEKDQWIMLYETQSRSFKDYMEKFTFQMAKTMELCNKHNIDFNSCLNKIMKHQ